jgi:hypothetical protein
MERGEELLLQFLGAGKGKLQGGGAHGSFSHCAKEEMGAESLGAMAAGRRWGSVCNSGGRQWGKKSSLLKIQGAMEQEAEEAVTKGREGGTVPRE